MPQPTLSQVHVNAPLTNMSVAYMNSQENYIASKVFPIVPVDKKSDVYYTYTKNDWFRDEAKPRGPSTESEGSGYNLSTGSYDCVVYAIHKDISDQIRQNSDSMLNTDQDAMRFVTDRIMLRQEVQWVSDFFATGKWANDVTPGSLWSDFTASDPTADVDLGKETILSVTGKVANTLVLGYQVYRQLIRHPLLREQIKYTSAENINEALLARIFDVERVLVARAVKATNVEGETATYSFTHGKNALLCYTTKAPSLTEASAGYIFSWKGVSGGMGKTVGVKKFRMEPISSDRVEGETAFACKVIGSDLGYFFSAVVS